MTIAERVVDVVLRRPAWNKGTGGCKRGHDPALYVRPPSGVAICLGCKRENGAKYRGANRLRISWRNRARQHGLTLLQLDQLFNSQRGLCAICRRVFNEGDYRIDHDHSTGVVRGLLCAACNTAIGLLKDSPTLLDNAKAYLNDYRD